MNKQQLIEAVAEYSGLNKSQAARAIDGVVNAIGDTLAAGENVVIVGFGTFGVKQRAERAGRNPQDGSPITIEAAKRATFKPGKLLNDRMNEG